MTTKIKTLWNVLTTNMQSGKWYDITDLYKIVEDNFNDFTEDDSAPVTPYNNEPTWRRNLRNALQTRRQSGAIIYNGSRQYQLPITAEKNVTLNTPPTPNIDSVEELTQDLEEEVVEDEPIESISRTEGGEKVIISRLAERDTFLRKEAIKIHGLTCKVCGFDFGKTYGDWGQGFIEVHHIHPLGQSKDTKVQTDPKKDLIVLCANCHRMIHRKRGLTLTIDELKGKLQNGTQQKVTVAQQ